MYEDLIKRIQEETERIKEQNKEQELEIARLKEDNKRLKQEYRDWVNKNIKYISKKSMASIIKDMLNGNV